jgi:hypothetical protein
MTAHADARAATPSLPRASFVLLAAAAVHAVIGFASQQMLGGYLDLSPSRVVFELRDAMPFVLAAGLVAGWDRWPAGRSWLAAAAIAFAVAATLDAASKLWLGLTWPPEPPAASVSVSADLLPVLASLALPFGPLLAAVGLWRAARAVQHGSRRLAAIGAVAVIAALIMATRLLQASAGLRSMEGLEVSEPFPGALVLANLAFSVGPGLIAVMAVAAIWAAPRRFFVPEASIAGGAIAAAIAALIAESLPPLVQGHVIDPAWIGWFGWTGYVELLGLLMVALGFFSARISVPGEN